MDLVEKELATPWLKLDEITLYSRLLIGFEQYNSPHIIKSILDVSRVEVVILTAHLYPGQDTSDPSIDFLSLSEIIDLNKYILCVTTSSATSAEEAINQALVIGRTLKSRIVKLDIRKPLGKRRYPDNEQTLEAARELVRHNLFVLPLIEPDIKCALQLQDLGCPALRVLAGEIGSQDGITNQRELREVAEALEIPVVAEGGIASPADVIVAFQVGAKAVLVNTAIAQSSDPVKMALAMRLSTESAGIYFSITHT